MKSVDPLTLNTIAEYKLDQGKDIEQKLDASQKAFAQWSCTSFQTRASLLHWIAAALEENQEEYASLMTLEMGKLKSEAVAEIQKCALVCRYYADKSETFLQDQPLASAAAKSYATFVPLGPILAIMPWNFPYWQVFRFAAPTLMAGNVGLLKHASNVTGCALAIEKLFKKACQTLALDYDTIFQTLILPSQSMKEVIADVRIKAVSLTGSTKAGQAVAAMAGQSLKKTVLELGGSDPYLVFEDADIEHAVIQCATSRLLNAGQSCIAAKRFIVHAKVYDEWLGQFCHTMAQRQMGNPQDTNTTLAPLANQRFQTELHQQVTQAIQQGAQCVLGGAMPEMKGCFYPPTVLTDVEHTMPIFYEELFGPVAVVHRVQNEQQAIMLANDSSFGLGACIFSKNIEKAESIAKHQLQAGSCYINGFVASHPNLPFGGIKQSGYGRELSHFGLSEFVNIKTVAVV